ncbi:MAG: tyrosine-type recombinase/integrase [Woeseiaceae bacterium]|nr:tyrosine-type recombinase/integrase [Woeseiaceae bacterium]
MSITPSFAPLLQGFFTQRLLQQRQASPHTISSYRDTFRLLLKFIQARLNKPPASLLLEEIDAPLIVAFLDDLEKRRGIAARSRNLRLTAIRSFFHYAAFEAPSQSEQIQRVLAIPSKRCTRALVSFLTRPEVEALLAAPDTHTWGGRRDHTLLMLSVQTGMRLSEMTGLKRQDVALGVGAHVRVFGKGRKERCIPLTRQTATIVNAWLREPARADSDVLLPNARGSRLSADGVRYILAKHVTHACEACPSLRKKHVTPHVLRHTMAIEMLLAGIDTTVIALWLGHESVETTQIYLDANLALKEKILAKMTPHDGKPGLYRPDDQLLAFLNNL